MTTRCESDVGDCELVVHEVSADRMSAAPIGSAIEVGGFFQAVAFSPDGGMLLVQRQAKDESHVLIYSTRRAHEIAPIQVAPPAKATLLSTSGAIAMLHPGGWTLWRPREDLSLEALAGHSGGELGVLSADARWLALVQGVGIALIDVTTGKVIGTCTGSEGAIESLALSQTVEGVALLAARAGDAITIWRVPSCDKTGTFDAGSDGARIALLGQGDRLLVTDRDSATMYDLTEGFEGVSIYVSAVSFEVRGEAMGGLRTDRSATLAIAPFSDNTARVFELATGREVALLPHGSDLIASATFCGTGMVCTHAYRSDKRGTPDGVFRMWQLPSLPHLIDQRDPSFGIPISAAVASEGSVLALLQYSAGELHLVLRDLVTARKLEALPLDTRFADSAVVAISGEGGHIVVILDGQLARFTWDGKALHRHPAIALEGSLLAAALGGADGKGCVAMVTRRSERHAVSLIDLATRSEQFLAVAPLVVTAHRRPDDLDIVGLAVDPRCQRVAVASGESEKPTLTVITPQGAASVVALASPVTAVAFLPDEERLLVGHWDGAVQSIATGPSAPARAVGRHDDTVTSITVDGSGRYVVSTSLDQSIRVWDVEVEPHRAVPTGLVSLPPMTYGIRNYAPFGPKAMTFTRDHKLRIVEVQQSGALVTEWPFFTTEGLMLRAREVFGER